jgi:subtilisin family serine protease
VAGIIAGSNASLKGVAPDAKIVAIQVFHFDNDQKKLQTSKMDILIAFDWILSEAKTPNIAAINMSFGGSQYSTACDEDLLAALIKKARDERGILTIIASGNQGYNGSVNYPGCISSAITVGATGRSTDSIIGMSNQSLLVDLLAPGQDILSSIPSLTKVGGDFASLSGTSMAAPHVAGAVAALKSIRTNSTANDIEAALKSTGQPVTDAGRTGLIYKRINVAAALTLIQIPKSIPIVISAVQPIGSYKDLVAITGGNFNLTDKFTLYDANGSIWASNLSVAYTPGSNEKYTNFSLPSLKAPSGCNATTSCTLKFRVTNANGYAEGSVVIRMEPKPPIVASAVQPIGSYEILVAITGGNFKLTDKFTLYDADGSIWASKLSVSYTPGSNDKYTNFSLPSLKAPSGCNTTTSCTLRFRVTNADGFAEGSVAIRKAP